ncbi:hypothetical protein SISNIDRAFT_412105 [Sistotremastrum niveocremeum HHB9708]|uniref:NAD(P)-binding domain-containing protein n=1 Tax=Sistotremastrum niveocremeum HHB9708 TaxID=1314777 RepID=A0A164TZG0_9AGAM|nr:hypothetical protein SISNIDRAFT_412105 [Sistotremastrum niveocremeum HHB9708]
MQNDVDILILGAGWTSTFLIPLLEERSLTYGATTRSGRDNTIPFAFDQDSEDSAVYSALPGAKTIVITFPINDKGGSERLTRLYRETHPNSNPFWVQLGSTGIWDKREYTWKDRHSPHQTSNRRAIAEDELLSLSPTVKATILNLCGLWGGSRSMRNYVGKVAPTKEALKEKGSLHLIHGYDVSRAILAVHEQQDKAAGNRWLLTDGRIYDWWDLASAWGDGGLASQDPVPSGPHPGWVRELMDEDGIKALPRSPEILGRALDSREFWSTFGLSPAKARP